MLTDPKLKSQLDQLWDKLWTGGLTNPLDAIEQLCFLLFLKQLDDEETRREKQAKLRKRDYAARLPADKRWAYWRNMEAGAALKHIRDVVFPWLRELGDKDSSFARYMATAEFKINKANLLIEVCSAIDELHISQQNQDVQGDLFEYLLGHLNTAGRNGQFRTPRHIIRLMVQMIDPQPRERIGDLAAGTCGFLVNAYQYILEKHTSPKVLTYDEDGWPHHLTGELLKDDERTFLQTQALRGYDNDSGMTMLRIGSMNLILHGVESPRFFYMDTLSKEFKETAEYEVILMNPPFKGAVDKGDVNPTLPGDTTKSELLFVHLILRALDNGGRCAVIVPDGVLFGSSRAHVNLRKKLIEENRLDGVVSMPGGVFKPYAGVSTAILLFTKGGVTERIWFYDMAHDGFSLDDKRQKMDETDLPDILECWRNRKGATEARPNAFYAKREKRLAELREQAAPLKAKRLKLLGEINRLTFEDAIAPDLTPLPPSPDAQRQERGEGRAKRGVGGEARAALEKDKAKLAELEAELAPLQKEIDQLSRQFWVTKAQVAANKYDLSASRYREADADETYYEKPQVTMERLLQLGQVMDKEVRELESMLK
jgi:type I restriction enzyme M protein